MHTHTRTHTHTHTCGVCASGRTQRTSAPAATTHDLAAARVRQLLRAAGATAGAGLVCGSLGERSLLAKACARAFRATLSRAGVKRAREQRAPFDWHRTSSARAAPGCPSRTLRHSSPPDAGAAAQAARGGCSGALCNGARARVGAQQEAITAAVLAGVRHVCDMMAIRAKRGRVLWRKIDERANSKACITRRARRRPPRARHESYCWRSTISASDFQLPIADCPRSRFTFSRSCACDTGKWAHTRYRQQPVAGAALRDS